jgi:hypothetical protein
VGSVFLNAESMFHELLVISGGSLLINAPVTAQAGFYLTNAGSFTLDGPDAVLNVTGTFLSSNYTLIADSGATVTWPTGADYLDRGNFDLFLPSGTLWRATDNSSRVTLPELTTVTGPTDSSVRSTPFVALEAFSGGTVVAPNLTEGHDRIQLWAFGNGSRVEAPSFASLIGPDSIIPAKLMADLSGVLLLTNGTVTLENTDVILDNGGRIEAGALSISSAEGQPAFR